MPLTVSLGGTDHQVVPPRRRIVVHEIARAWQESPERAIAALLGLACPTWWSKDRREPSTYRGDALSYGADVYETFADAGLTHTDILKAGLVVWREWKSVTVSEAAVKEARDFTGAPAEETSGSGEPSS